MVAAQNLINYQNKHSNLDSSIMVSAKTGFLNTILGFFSKIVTVMQSIVTSAEYGFISTYSINRIELKEIYMAQPDVIHVHNWYNTLNMRSIKKISEKFPIVFTLHDERMLTGGCHMTLGCTNFKTNCAQCPASFPLRKSIVRSKKNINKFSGESIFYAVTAPSKWLFHYVQLTQFGKHAGIIEMIPNISSEYESMENQTQSKVKNVESFIFIASNINEPIKGLAQLIRALDEIISDKPDLMNRITLTVVGNGKPILSEYLKIDYVGALSNAGVNEALAKSSLCLIPSKTENMPNVLIEAIRAGVVVLASDVGGIPEVVVDGYSGLLCRPDLQSLKTGIQRYLKLNENEKIIINKNASQHLQERLNNKLIAESYEAIYNNSIRMFQNRISKL